MVLGSFTKLRKRTISFIMPACPSICLTVKCETTRLPVDGFLWNFVSETFSKTFRKIQFRLKSEKSNGCFIRIIAYICDNTWLSSSENEKYFKTWVVEKIKTQILWLILDSNLCTIILFLWLYSSTCFGHPCAHLQEDQLYIHNNWFNVISFVGRTVGRLVKDCRCGVCYCSS